MEECLGPGGRPGRADRRQRGRAQPGRAGRRPARAGGPARGWTRRSRTWRATTCSPAPPSSASGRRSPRTPTWARSGSPSACGPARTSSSPGGSPTPRWSSGPGIAHFGWGRDDLDALAGAVVAGHVLECGAQATGGNLSFFDEHPLDRLLHPGFPLAELAADGSCVITKHPGTGGVVDRGHRHRPAALRDRRPALRRPGRGGPVRHRSSWPTTARTGCGSPASAASRRRRRRRSA